MNRYINKLTLHKIQPCIKEVKDYIEINIIEPHEQQRISRTYGNVNLTDYWFSVLDDIMNQNASYVAQDVLLLSDNEKDWWKNQIDVGTDHIGIGFVKVDVDNNATCEGVKNFIKSCVNNAKFFYTFGNADFIFAFSATTREEIEEKCNLIYGEERLFYSLYIIYGKMTKQANKYRFDEYSIYKLPINKTHKMYDDGWCNDIRKRINKHMEINREGNNKKMLSYYHALLQIINVISQYEQEKIRKDMFYVFYPSIELFLTQLETAEKSLAEMKDKSVGYYEQKKMIETSIGEFIDATEVLMYHMGQSCKNLIEDAGCGGLPYDVPLRLCLMYLAYLNLVTSVINDDDTLEYEYCITPLAYSTPTTKYFEFGLEKGSRLINIQISKPALYMPRSLLIICGHEVSHYVNSSARHRVLRSKCYFIAVTTALTNALISDESLMEIKKNLKSKEWEVLSHYIKSTQGKMWKYLYTNISKKWTQKYGDKESNYYLDDLMTTSSEIITEVTTSLGEDIREIIYSLDEDVYKAIVDEGRDCLEKSKDDLLYPSLMRLQEILEIRIRQVWGFSYVRSFVEAFAKNLKEIFADISAILILNLEPDDFFEAYLVSESHILHKEDIKPELLNRMAIVTKIMADKGVGKWRAWLNQKISYKFSKKNKNYTFKGEEFVVELRLRMRDYLSISRNTRQRVGLRSKEFHGDNFYCKEIIEAQTIYLGHCFDSIQQKLDEATGSEKRRVKLIRELLKHFQVCEIGKDTSYEALFDTYTQILDEYKADVKTKFESKQGTGV